MRTGYRSRAAIVVRCGDACASAIVAQLDPAAEILRPRRAFFVVGRHKYRVGQYRQVPPSARTWANVCANVATVGQQAERRVPRATTAIPLTTPPVPGTAPPTRDFRPVSAAATSDSCGLFPAFFGYLVKGPPVHLELGMLATQRLPALDQAQF
jgi:hypothetical protein